MTDVTREAELARANEEIYKHNREIARQNKVLSFLTMLYAVGTKSLTPRAFATEVASLLQVELECELVVLAQYHAEQDTLITLASAQSARSQETQSVSKDFFASTPIVHVTQHPALGALCGGVEQVECSVQEVWNTTPQEKVTAWAGSVHAASCVVMRLYADHEMLGAVYFVQNRVWDAHTQHERDLLSTIQTVLSALFGKAMGYEALQVSNAELARISAQKSVFLSFASHQLRTPLQSIIGYLSLLHEGAMGVLPEKAAEAVGNLLQSSTIMTRTIEDFLDASKIEQGVMQYVREPFDIRQLVQSVVFELSVQAQKKGVALLEDSEGVSCIVNGDIAKCKHVFINLIDNAIKYTPAGTVHVWMVHDKESKSVQIHVRDNGIGIDNADVNKLFEKFSRGSTAKDSKIAGTGVGLYVAKELVTAHGGTIAVHSGGRGLGTEFIVTLPVAST